MNYHQLVFGSKPDFLLLSSRRREEEQVFKSLNQSNITQNQSKLVDGKLGDEEEVNARRGGEVKLRDQISYLSIKE